ncbi:adenosine deaminase/editase [Xylariomycetidae sp. FL2044]|nr:adenosine deaminase/editase [Xylariomycetidae sp. FL2044]
MKRAAHNAAHIIPPILTPTAHFIDQIASLVQKHYDALPAKRKPVVRSNGVHEWVPLSGIVAEGKDNKLTCLSLATGMKCLPSTKIPQARGSVLHDWHAEVLAIRAFNVFVLHECRLLLSSLDYRSEFIRRRTTAEVAAAAAASTTDPNSPIPWQAQPFAWRDDVRLHMYCSEAPCGDASMELTMAAQEDATPWPVPVPLERTPSSAPQPQPQLLPGRSYFSSLAQIRRKPSRADAPPTLSKSCSDKLSQAQCTSLLSSLASLLVSPRPAYLRTLVLPEAAYTATGCARAFGFGEGGEGEEGGRMRAVAGSGESSSSSSSSSTSLSYAFTPFDVVTTTHEFRFSKRVVAMGGGGETEQKEKEKKETKTAGSNVSAAWTAHGLEESTIGGVLQGRRAADGASGASFASRRRMWGLAVEVAGLLEVEGNEEGNGDDHVSEIRRALSANTYGEVKGSRLLEARRKMKAEVRTKALKGWVRNAGDEDFGLVV